MTTTAAPPGLPPAARQTVPLARLHPNPLNLRKPRPADLANMEESLRANGLLTALKACPSKVLPAGDLLVADGTTRVPILRALGHAEVQVDVYERELTGRELLVLQLTLDAAAQKLGLKQVAEGAKTLLETGEFETVRDVARAIGCSPGWLSKAFTAVNRLHPALLNSDLPLTVQYEIAKADDPQTQLLLAQMYRDGHLSRDGIADERDRRCPARPAVKKGRPVRLRGKSLTGALSGTHEAVEAEAVRLVKAIQKAKALGLGLSAVPDLMNSP